jgi:hypothetical protein
MKSNLLPAMKAASVILAIAALAPISLLFGVSVTAAFSVAATAGILAIAVSDYGHSAEVRTPAPRRQSERHPLAA